VTRVPIKYGRLSWLLTLVGVPRGAAFLDWGDDEVVVRMGWAFRCRIPRTEIGAVTRRARVVSVGAHGWRGRWLVNGAQEPIVELMLRAPVRAHVAGVPIRLRALLLSVDDPDAFLRLARST
jgi:hypothetical protein